MADVTKQLGKALGLNQEQGFVEYFKGVIKQHQGDGVSARTHAAMREAGVDVDPEDVQDGLELVSRQTMAEVPKDATIAMPDGTRITPLQYQKLQQVLLKRK